MILHADHGLNNSTFTTRVIISTMSDVYLRSPGDRLRAARCTAGERGRREDAQRDQERRRCRGVHHGQDRMQGEDHGLGTGSTRPRTRVRPTCSRWPRSSPKTPATRSLYAKSHIIEQVMAANSREGHLPQRRLLLGDDLPLHRPETRPVHADTARAASAAGPAHARAPGRQPPVPPEAQYVGRPRPAVRGDERPVSIAQLTDSPPGGAAFRWTILGAGRNASAGHAEGGLQVAILIQHLAWCARPLSGSDHGTLVAAPRLLPAVPQPLHATCGDGFERRGVWGERASRRRCPCG